MVRTGDRKRIGVLAIATTLLALTACGDDGGSGSGEAAGGDGAGSATLTMTEAGCDPVSLSAPAGGVEFAVTNESGLKGEFEVISSRCTGVHSEPIAIALPASSGGMPSLRSHASRSASLTPSARSSSPVGGGSSAAAAPGARTASATSHLSAALPGCRAR